MSTEVRLSNVRIFAPKIFAGQEEAFQGKGNPYFSSTFILNKDHNPAEMQALKAAIREAAELKFGPNADSMLKVFQAKDKLPLHDGDLKADKNYGAAFAGKLYVSARHDATKKAAPPVFDKAIDPTTGKARAITSASDPRAPYPGSYVNVILSLYAYSVDGGQGVGASIMGIQFANDGERLAIGGRIASASDFEAVPEEVSAGVAPASAASAASLF